MTAMLLASFDAPRKAALAARHMQEAGHTICEAHSPLPSEELSAAVGKRASRIRIVMFIAAALGVLAGLFTQFWSAVFDYPINSGGRPLASWPAFIPVAFEIGIISAAFAGLIAFLFDARLTGICAPVFDNDDIERASQDRVFLEIKTARPNEARQLLASSGALTITEPPI